MRYGAVILLRIGWGVALILVMVLALLPVEHLQLPVFDWWDKAQHVLAFAVLTGWAQWLWPQRHLRIALAMVLYGAAIEIAQWAVGWRFAEWADVLADAIGVMSSWALTGALQHLSVAARQAPSGWHSDAATQEPDSGHEN